MTEEEGPTKGKSSTPSYPAHDSRPAARPQVSHPTGFSKLERAPSRAGLYKVSDVIRRGQDSNLQSSGHEPDESTNSSTPLLSLFPPGFACLAGIEPALRLRPGAPLRLGLRSSPLPPFVHEQSRPLRGRLEKEKKSSALKQLNVVDDPNVVVLYLTLPRLLL